MTPNTDISLQPPFSHCLVDSSYSLHSAKDFVQVSKAVSNYLYSGSHYPDNFSKNTQKIPLFIYLLNCFAEGEVCFLADDRKDFKSEFSKLDILKRVQLSTAVNNHVRHCRGFCLSSSQGNVGLP